MTDEVFNLMKYFPNSYIKANKELILEEKGNVYFSLDKVDDKFDLCLKVVQYVSRSACKAQPYRDECQNLMYQSKNREYLHFLSNENLAKFLSGSPKICDEMKDYCDEIEDDYKTCCKMCASRWL